MFKFCQKLPKKLQLTWLKFGEDTEKAVDVINNVHMLLF